MVYLLYGIKEFGIDNEIKKIVKNNYITNNNIFYTIRWTGSNDIFINSVSGNGEKNDLL